MDFPCICNSRLWKLASDSFASDSKPSDPRDKNTATTLYQISGCGKMILGKNSLTPCSLL